MGVMRYPVGLHGCRGDGRLSAEPPKKLLDDHCGTQAEMVDASLGIMGIMRIMRIMGIVGGVMRYPEGLHVAVAMGLTVLPLRQSHEL